MEMGPACGSSANASVTGDEGMGWGPAPWGAAVEMAGFGREASGFADGWMWIINQRATKDYMEETGRCG